ncbi:MAG: hypothetical protein IPQ08_08710 [Chitinophagaceae bacterium]|nr:hypothetical protein [Chitinophagaceae bacterium]
MKLLSLISLMFFSSNLLAQGSWQIIVNRKLQISGSISDENKNVKTIKSSDWKSGGYLDIRYKPQGNYKFVLQLTDETGNEQWKIDTTSAKLKLSTIRKLFAGKKEMKIYMILNPPNDMMMAPSKILHLGTLKLP